MATDLLPITMSATSTGAPVAILTLEQPGRPVVVIDESLLKQLDATLDTLPESLGGFVLASAAPRAFVAGADLKAIMAMSDPELHAYLEFGARVFQKIADLPCPSVAAIHSVTLGGGLELAMHCDGLVAVIDPEARPFIIGLPEAGLKICPGWGGTNLLPARIDAKTAIVATANGIPFKSLAANKLGLFDATCEQADELLATAIRWIEQQPTDNRTGNPSRSIQASNTEAISAALDDATDELSDALHVQSVLDAIRTGINSGWQAALQCERDHLVRLRHSEPAQDAITAFFSK